MISSIIVGAMKTLGMGFKRKAALSTTIIQMI